MENTEVNNPPIENERRSAPRNFLEKPMSIPTEVEQIGNFEVVFGVNKQ